MESPGRFAQRGNEFAGYWDPTDGGGITSQHLKRPTPREHFLLFGFSSSSSWYPCFPLSPEPPFLLFPFVIHLYCIGCEVE